MSSQLSFENVNTNQLTFGENETNNNSPQFEGNIIENTRKDLGEIGAGITTLAGAILGTDKEARQNFVNIFKEAIRNPQDVPENVLNTMLSTYNITVDDVMNMPFGELVGNVLEGAWEHPVQAGLDIASMFSSAGLKIPSKLRSKIKVLDDADVRIKAAEQVTKDNIRVTNYGEDFVRKINDIEKKYTPKQISDSLQWIETRGIKRIPRELRRPVVDILRANTDYQRMYVAAGVELADPVDMATRELIARQFKVPVSKLEDATFENSQLFKDTKDYVIRNNIKPVFHLEPKILEDLQNAENINSNLLKRKFGTMDYEEAGKDITRKADTFVQRLVKTKVNSSIKSVNDLIKKHNDTYGTNVKTLSAGNKVLNNELISDLNNELRKTMLGAGTYLGANVLATTLSILNNFDVGAVQRTLQKAPKFRLIELEEANTPIINILSRVNNKFYRPITSVDKWLERVGARYIQEAGIDNAKFMQSMVPTLTVTTNPILRGIRALVPFGSYPSAAIPEVISNVTGKPEKAATLMLADKAGQQVNEEVQSNIQQLKELNPSTVVRENSLGQLVQRNSVVTPIQAANMFLLGEQGDAIQIPILNFINELVRGEGDPNVFTVNGRQYRMDKGKVKTSQGEFDLLPSIAWVARQFLTPVQFYNSVLVPLMSDKYVADQKKLFNQMVTDSQYSNLGTLSKRKVKTEATEKLGKRILGTYEWNYYKPYVTRSSDRNVRRQMLIRRNIERELNQ